jgi:hypothetical protein
VQERRSRIMKALNFATGQDQATKWHRRRYGQRDSDFVTIVGLAFDADISGASSGLRQEWPFQIRPTLSARHHENDRNQAGFRC